MEKSLPSTPVFELKFMPEEAKLSPINEPEIKTALQLGEYIYSNNGTIPQDLIKLTEEKTNIKKLNLKHLRLNNQSIKHLSVILYFLKSAEEADFSDMQLYPQDIKVLSPVLYFFSELVELHLNSNQVKTGAGFLADGLKGMQKLEHLDLNDCSIDQENFVLLCPGIKSLKKLQILQLSFNPISDLGCSSLCEALVELPLLVSLELFTCGISNAGGQYLMKVFQVTHLQNVLLGNNRFSPSFENKIKGKFRFVHVGIRHNRCYIL